MKILVLGGTGAMGVDLVRILAERGENVIVTSRAKRESAANNVKYLQGDAHDPAFLQSLLRDSYGAIVDFMVYTTEEFQYKVDLFLNSTKQYVFMSSSRVYADSKTPITENSARLLEVCKDEVYLKTDEYALSKARQEDLLCESGKSNWTQRAFTTRCIRERIVVIPCAPRANDRDTEGHSFAHDDAYLGE